MSIIILWVGFVQRLFLVVLGLGIPPKSSIIIIDKMVGCNMVGRIQSHFPSIKV